MDRVGHQCQNYERGCGTKKYLDRPTIAPIYAQKYQVPVTIFHMLAMSIYVTYSKGVHENGEEIQILYLIGIEILKNGHNHFYIMVYIVSGGYQNKEEDEG